MPIKVEKIIDLNMFEVTVSKGITIPTEPYGGDKFGSIRLDIAMKGSINEGKVSETVDKINGYLDQHMNQLIIKEINALKGEK